MPVESGRQCIAYLQSCPKQSGLHQSLANLEDLRGDTWKDLLID
jgi:hypothetical protein